jgi:hypothetical protein
MAEDLVNHPSHYTDGPFECDLLAKQLDFNTGCLVKYLYRYKTKGDPIMDLAKAYWYSQHLDVEWASVLIKNNFDIKKKLAILRNENWADAKDAWNDLLIGDYASLSSDIDKLLPTIPEK